VIEGIFQRHLEGITQPDIAKWANTQNHTVRWKGKPPKPFKWDKDEVRKALIDPVYAGVLKYGKSVTKLSDHYDFNQLLVSRIF
jgi:hypothetical protein